MSHRNDLHADMMEDLEWYDTPNFGKDHPLFSNANKRVLGKCKSETGDSLSSEFCGLRSKMYSLFTPSEKASKSFRKAKGIPKSYVKKTCQTRTIFTRFEQSECHKVQISSVQVGEPRRHDSEDDKNLPQLHRRQEISASGRHSIARIQRHSDDGDGD